MEMMTKHVHLNKSFLTITVMIIKSVTEEINIKNQNKLYFFQLKTERKTESNHRQYKKINIQ